MHLLFFFKKNLDFPAIAQNLVSAKSKNPKTWNLFRTSTSIFLRSAEMWIPFFTGQGNAWKKVISQPCMCFPGVGWHPEGHKVTHRIQKKMGGMESYVIESYFYIDSPKFESSLGFVQFSKQCRLALSNLRTPEKNIGICSERSLPKHTVLLRGHLFALMMVPPESLANFQCTSFKKAFATNHNTFSTGVMKNITKQSMHYCGLQNGPYIFNI